MIVVSDAEACKLLDVGRAYDAVCAAYRQASMAPPVLSTPSAQFMRHPTSPLAMKVKGAQLPDLRVCGFRLVFDHHAPDGAESDSHDWQWVANLDTGEPLGVVAMSTLHALRTALTGLVALEALRGPDRAVVAVLGAGRIADWLIAPLRERIGPVDIRVVASRAGRADAFAARHRITAAASVDAAVAGANAVICITSAASPVLEGRHFGLGMTLIGMGGAHECDVSVLTAADRFFVDDFDFASVSGSMGAWLRHGEIDRDAAHGRLDGELGQVLAGRVPGRTSPAERVFAIVQGMACCDLAIAADILSRALGNGARHTLSAVEPGPT